MVATEAVLITTVIDVTKGCNVTVVNVPGAFLTADMDEDVLLFLNGTLAEVMESIEPSLYARYMMQGGLEIRYYIPS